MLFVFLRAQNLGKAFYNRCSKCCKKTWRDLYKGRKWFTVYYIPLIPLRKTYQLRCKYCGQDFEIKKGFLNIVLNHYCLTQQMLRKKITQEEYIARTGSEMRTNKLF